MSIEAMKQALEALDSDNPDIQLRAAIALRTAIAEAEKQEPVAWIKRSEKGNIIDLLNEPDDGAEPLYTTPQPQQDAWKNAAIRLGEELSSVGPDGYYNMTAEQWLDWAMDQQPRGKNSLSQPQREWVGLTQAERHDIREWQKIQEELGPVWSPMMLYLYEAIEAKLKEKNT